MTFWLNYLDREPILAMAWMALAAYETTGADFGDYYREVL